MGQVKRAFGAGVKGPSKWIMFVKEFASKNGMIFFISFIFIQSKFHI
jgi:hypothetical protein